MKCSDFTAEFKDSVLRQLCERFQPYNQWSGIEKKDFTDDFVLLNTCLMQFQKIGLIDNYRQGTGSTFALEITADAITLFNRGGFTFLEDRYLKDLEKANLELDKLRSKPGLKEYVEQISGVSSIISNLIAAVGVIRG